MDEDLKGRLRILDGQRMMWAIVCFMAQLSVCGREPYRLGARRPFTYDELMRAHTVVNELNHTATNHYSRLFRNASAFSTDMFIASLEHAAGEWGVYYLNWSMRFALDLVERRS